MPKLTYLPAPGDMVREMRRQKPAEAERVLMKWLQDAHDEGYDEGLTEGLKRGREGTTLKTLSELQNEKKYE